MRQKGDAHIYEAKRGRTYFKKMCVPFFIVRARLTENCARSNMMFMRRYSPAGCNTSPSRRTFLKTCAAVSLAATSSRAAEPELRKPTVAPAMKDIRAPRIKLPAGTCDCHAHIFGPQATYPYLADAAYIPPDQTLDDYVRIHKTLGVQRGVLVQPSVYGTDHAAIIAAMKSGKFNFRGVAVTAADDTPQPTEEFHQTAFSRPR